MYFNLFTVKLWPLMREWQLGWSELETVRRLSEEILYTSLIVLYSVLYFLMVVNLVEKVNENTKMKKDK